VLPEFQKKGIGSELMKYSIATAKESGFSGMILFGNPDYYHRFGFRNAQEYSITTKDGQNFEPFMALELQNNGLVGVKGRFYEDDAFEYNSGELIEFEKRFPYKEKLVTDTQLK
jgi:predicted N-acetyltransferase YhbS